MRVCVLSVIDTGPRYIHTRSHVLLRRPRSRRLRGDNISRYRRRRPLIAVSPLTIFFCRVFFCSFNYAAPVCIPHESHS